MFRNMSTFAITLWLSAMLHFVAIAIVKFDAPDLKFFKDKMPPLDVVLVNAKTKTKPTKADALAQANLNRGGNTDADRKLKSALPPPKEKLMEVAVKPSVESRRAARAAASAEAEAERKEQRIAELEKHAQELMTQIKGKKPVDSQPTQKPAAPQLEKGEQEPASKSVSGTDLAASSLDIARLEAQIAKQQDDYQKRPKRKFIGARTQEYRFAAYVESWRQKVEKVGNLNYPQAAKDQGIYGRLRLTVSIKADGSIETVVINQSSGSKILDDAATRIVELAAPYAAFPEDVRKDTDILSITRTWSFTTQDNLATE